MKYPYLTTLLNEAIRVNVVWGCDEQQADGRQRNWMWSVAKKELRELLDVQPEDSENALCVRCGKPFDSHCTVNSKCDGYKAPHR